jgi:hypothetical protein
LDHVRNIATELTGNKLGFRNLVRGLLLINMDEQGDPICKLATCLLKPNANGILALGDSIQLIA